ncbi:DUF1746-domain-containing protein [Sporormia fimetaria CBS 119925]|uniref:DUF1746-domain-containing protein n=1 Tax=Sporormia fimetaria CBS 119925 TaxID=1340428 RepID=A0A6A6VNL6_9PLEO|nr:DUF1746-domain-containing protein [Sporormia fimetaria CBS 119925]
MSDEAESSHASRAYGAASPSETEQDASDHDQVREGKRERGIRIKRGRLERLQRLLTNLDSLVFLELVTIYYLDCSFFWFAIKAIMHISTLSPPPSLNLHTEEPTKPVLFFTLSAFIVNLFLHLFCKAPSAGEDTRGYLHGGVIIDFIGQQGPTSKWKLGILDFIVLVLQLIMVSVTAKKRDLKKKLKQMTDNEPHPGEGSIAAGIVPNLTSLLNRDREQDTDAEERGVLRRSDTLSDGGEGIAEHDALLSDSADTGSTDAIDLLSSGQAVIGRFTLIDTLLQEHADYRLTTTTTTGLSPDALRQLHRIRVLYGVGGG